jgi:ribosome-associated protein YbcJ (S4-like RNA binding protein)
MKLLLSILLVLCTTPSLSQQQGRPPEQQPPAMMSPRAQTPSRQIPPDTRAPTPGELASPDIQQQLQKELSRDPVLSGANVKAVVDDQNIVLDGTVESRSQHDLALQLAQSYAGQRKIVDKIVIRQKT